MKIAIGSDHAGFALKTHLITFLQKRGMEVNDLGTDQDQSADYPDYGRKVAEIVSEGNAEKGILICGSGIGMSIVANKVTGIKAALCHDVLAASLSRAHTDANILVLGGRVTESATAEDILNAWLQTEFEGGRHLARIDKIHALEKSQPVKSPGSSRARTGLRTRSSLKNLDPEIYDAIRHEIKREQEKIILIASENYASPAVLEAQGSVMTNKYAEGYPGKRYYGGCEFVDLAESLAIERARELFGAEHANVQPHSGTQANMSVYLAMLKPGDCILSMNLAHGGHLSHGHSVNFSGSLFRPVFYGVNRETGRIDYDEIQSLALEHHPKLIVVGASAYSRAFDFEQFRKIADRAGALMMVDMAHFAGLVAAGVHSSPVPFADIVTSTTQKTLRGPRGGLILCRSQYARAIDRSVFPGTQGGPLMHVVAAKAVAFREAMSPEFVADQRQTVENAQTLCAAFQSNGYDIISGGTDTHLFLVDLRKQGLTGRDAELALDLAGITVNKNAVPFDDKPPAITSGIRLGTPSVSTRGMMSGEMGQIAEIMHSILKKPEDQRTRRQAQKKVRALCKKYPIYK